MIECMEDSITPVHLFASTAPETQGSQNPPFDPATQPDQFLEWVITPAGQTYLAGLNKALVEQRARSGGTPDTGMVQVVQAQSHKEATQ